MKIAAYNTFCKSLPHAWHVVQWGGAHVWKVGGPKGKVFAIAWDEGAKGVHVTFKVTPTSYAILKEQSGLRPAPYLASRGMTWIQRTSPESMDDRSLKDYIRRSHRLCGAGLSMARQKELGLSARSA